MDFEAQDKETIKTSHFKLLSCCFNKSIHLEFKPIVSTYSLILENNFHAEYSVNCINIDPFALKQQIQHK